MWTLEEDGSVDVAEHADGAGNPVVTILVDDLDAHVATRRSTPVHSVFVHLYRRIRIATLLSREGDKIAARG